MPADPDLKIRAAGVDDAAAMVSLLADVAAEGLWIRSESPLDMAGRTSALQADLSSRRAVAFVANSGGSLAGELTIHLRENSGYLGMCVALVHRNKGVGKGLLDAALEWAAEARLSNVTLEVFTHNAAAIVLYTSRGFSESGPRRFIERKGGSWEALVMAKTMPRAEENPR